MFRFKTLSAGLMLAGALLGCGGAYGGAGSMAPPPPPPSNTIAATNGLIFTPSTLTVAVGQTVTFTFGGVAHNVFFDAKPGVPADIAGNNANVSITRQFGTAGSYPFNCHIHPGMSGTVVVQ
jgi:plastocyanin